MLLGGPGQQTPPCECFLEASLRPTAVPWHPGRYRCRRRRRGPEVRPRSRPLHSPEGASPSRRAGVVGPPARIRRGSCSGGATATPRWGGGSFHTDPGLGRLRHHRRRGVARRRPDSSCCQRRRSTRRRLRSWTAAGSARARAPEVSAVEGPGCRPPGPQPRSPDGSQGYAQPFGAPLPVHAQARLRRTPSANTPARRSTRRTCGGK